MSSLPHDTFDVMFWVEPSAYWPVALNWVTLPGVISAGPVMEIEVRTEIAFAVTAAVALVTFRYVAVISVWPAPTARTRPRDTEATAGLLERHSAWEVTSYAFPLANVAEAVSWRVWPTVAVEKSPVTCRLLGGPMKAGTGDGDGAGSSPQATSPAIKAAAANTRSGVRIHTPRVDRSIG